MRTSEVKRTTGETDIYVSLCLDGTGKSEIDTGVGFLDHMLTLLAKHAGFDMIVKAAGDTYVDDHHTTEDVGIALGTALKKALGDKKGVTRYGSCILPMDEALVMTAADLSGRDWLSFDLDVPSQQVGTFDTELVREFFQALTRNAEMTLHIKKLAGWNTHHIIEAAFKSTARSLRQAIEIDEKAADEIPSTKGIL